MGKTYEELMAELSAKRRKRVEARAAELIAEVKSLRDLRKARQLTQQRMAKRLGVRQHSISRMEQRSDMLLSTLRDYIGKMGGELVLTAQFPDRDPVRIKGFADIARSTETRRSPLPPHAVAGRPRPSQRLRGAHQPASKGKSRSRIRTSYRSAQA